MSTKIKPSAPTPPPRRHATKYIAPLVIAVAALIAFHNSFQGAFIYDDVHAIQLNPYIRSIGTCFSAPSQASLAGRPIASLSFALTYQIFNRGSPPIDSSGQPPQLDTTGFHIVNLVIHILAALVLYGVIRRILLSPRLGSRFEKSAELFGAIVAVLWVIHPIQTQSVTYIIQRIESLAGLFYLLTVYCSIRSFEKGSFSIWSVFAVLVCALGMGTKEIMATAPIMVLAVDYLFYSTSLRQCFSRSGSLYAGMAATWFILAALMIGGPRSASAGFGVKGVAPWDYLKTEAGVILHYIRLSFWPAHLCLDYGWPLAARWQDYLPQMLVIAVLLGLTLFGLWRRSPLAILGVWFFVILAPTSSFVPIKDPAFEQRMYLPLAAIIVIVALVCHLALEKVSRLPRLVIATLLSASVAVLLMRRTIERNEDYRDPLIMWSKVLELRPDNGRALSSMGTELINRGRAADSIQYYEKSVRIEPRNWKYWENLGRALHKNKQDEQAIDAYKNALAINSGAFTTHYDMGVIYFDLGKLAESAQAYARALQCEGGDDYRVHFNLGNTLLQLNRPKEAEAHFRRALQLRPGFDKAINQLKLIGASTG